MLGLANQYDLGDNYSARVDRFNTMDGNASFEIHVYKGNVEVGVLGPNGWINKHNFTEPPEFPKKIGNACNGIAVNEMRQAGHIPERGEMNIKAGRWQKLLKALPWLGTAGKALEPSNDRKCGILYAQEGCYPQE